MLRVCMIFSHLFIHWNWRRWWWWRCWFCPAVSMENITTVLSRSTPFILFPLSPSMCAVCVYKFGPNAVANFANRMAWYFDSNNSNNKMYSVKTDIARRWTFIVDVGSLVVLKYAILLFFSYSAHDIASTIILVCFYSVHMHTHTQCHRHSFTFAHISTEFTHYCRMDTPYPECSDGAYNVKKFMEIVIEIAMKQNVSDGERTNERTDERGTVKMPNPLLLNDNNNSSTTQLLPLLLLQSPRRHTYEIKYVEEICMLQFHQFCLQLQPFDVITLFIALHYYYIGIKLTVAKLSTLNVCSVPPLHAIRTQIARERDSRVCVRQQNEWYDTTVWSACV